MSRVSPKRCMRARRAKNFPEFFRCQSGLVGGGLDQKFLKDIPQFCMFSSVVHAEFCWICGLFPQYARARCWKNFLPRARVYPCARAVQYSTILRAPCMYGLLHTPYKGWGYPLRFIGGPEMDPKPPPFHLWHIAPLLVAKMKATWYHQKSPT